MKGEIKGACPKCGAWTYLYEIDRVPGIRFEFWCLTCIGKRPR